VASKFEEPIMIAGAHAARGQNHEPALQRAAALRPTARALREIEARLGVLAARHRLTARQREIVRFVVLGFSNKEIARDLRCSVVTVEAHMTAVLRRTGSEGRGTLVARFWSEFDLEVI
jgi:DNA-binding NarL/FixJ family response regulator